MHDKSSSSAVVRPSCYAEGSRFESSGETNYFSNTNYNFYNIKLKNDECKLLSVP